MLPLPRSLATWARKAAEKIWKPKRPYLVRVTGVWEAFFLPIRQNLLGWKRADRQNREIPNR
jgi:hypothetical protein